VIWAVAAEVTRTPFVLIHIKPPYFVGISNSEGISSTSFLLTSFFNIISEARSAEKKHVDRINPTDSEILQSVIVLVESAWIEIK